MPPKISNTGSARGASERRDREQVRDTAQRSDLAENRSRTSTGRRRSSTPIIIDALLPGPLPKYVEPDELISRNISLPLTESSDEDDDESLFMPRSRKMKLLEACGEKLHELGVKLSDPIPKSSKRASRSQAKEPVTPQRQRVQKPRQGQPRVAGKAPQTHAKATQSTPVNKSGAKASRAETRHSVEAGTSNLAASSNVGGGEESNAGKKWRGWKPVSEAEMEEMKVKTVETEFGNIGLGIGWTSGRTTRSTRR